MRAEWTRKGQGESRERVPPACVPGVPFPAGSFPAARPPPADVILSICQPCPTGIAYLRAEGRQMGKTRVLRAVDLSF